MKRSVTITKQCCADGCKKFARWTFNSNAEYLRSYEFRKYEKEHQPYYCAKHCPDHTILSPTILKSEWISEPAKPLEDHPNEPYRSFGSKGIMFGPGFVAEGSDFPVGTRIKVTAEVILP